MLKKFLDDHKVTYTTKMADENQEYAQELLEKSGQLGVPFSLVEDEKGTTIESVLGFDIQKFNKMLQEGVIVAS
jgi:glutaredoxin